MNTDMEKSSQKHKIDTKGHREIKPKEHKNKNPKRTEKSKPKGHKPKHKLQKSHSTNKNLDLWTEMKKEREISH